MAEPSRTPLFVFGSPGVATASPQLASAPSESIFTFGETGSAREVFRFGEPSTGSSTQTPPSVRGADSAGSMTPFVASPGCGVEAGCAQNPVDLPAGNASMQSYTGDQALTPCDPCRSGAIATPSVISSAFGTPAAGTCECAATPCGSLSQGTHNPFTHAALAPRKKGPLRPRACQERSRAVCAEAASGAQASDVANAVPSSCARPPEEAALQEAQAQAKGGQYAEAAKSCLRVLGPAFSGIPQVYMGALELLGSMVADWEKACETQARGHENDMQSLTAQIMNMKEAGTAKMQLQKEKHDQKQRELAREKHLRSQAEKASSSLRWQMNELREHSDWLEYRNSQLESQLRRVGARAPTREDVVQKIAELEVAPLRTSSTVERERLKKRLLLKWHPDKQPSPSHQVLATQVMQQLQLCDEWS